MRYAAQVRLRNAVFHWARVAVLNDPKCRSRYAALRARGHSYGRALRGVGDRLLGVACVLLRRGRLFDPDYGSSAPAWAAEAIAWFDPSFAPTCPAAEHRAPASSRRPRVAPAPSTSAQRLGPCEHGTTLKREDKTCYVGCLTAGRRSHHGTTHHDTPGPHILG